MQQEEFTCLGQKMIQAWMRSNNLSIKDFSELVKMSYFNAYHFVKGKRIPSISTALLFQKTTNGFVKMEYWLEDVSGKKEVHTPAHRDKKDSEKDCGNKCSAPNR